MDKYNIDEIINELSEGKSLIKERSDFLHKAKQKQRKIRTLKTKYSFLAELVKQADKKDSTSFDLLITKYFRKVGFKKVKHLGKNKKREDVQIIHNNIAFIIECRGKENKPANKDDVGQLPFRNTKIINDPKLQDKELFFIMVFDHNYSKHVTKRGDALNDEIRKYLSDGINVHGSLITPLELLNGFIKLINKHITFDEYVEKLKTKTLIKF